MAVARTGKRVISEIYSISRSEVITVFCAGLSARPSFNFSVNADGDPRVVVCARREIRAAIAKIFRMLSGEIVECKGERASERAAPSEEQGNEK